jgi:Dolichyl-phosphate-mannose-protein mannosyltransferase
MTAIPMWCVLYLCCLFIAGYAVTAALARTASPVEIAGLSLCMGPAIIGILLIFLSMIGIRPARAEILIISALFAVAAIFFSSRRSPQHPPNTPVVKWLAVICLAAIAYGMIAITIDALGFPVIEWDAFAIWQLKAQVLALQPLHPRPNYFSNLNLSFSHLRYPLLVPMMSAGMHAMTDRLDDLGKTISLLLFPGMITAVFAAVRKINGTTAALAAAGLLASLEPMFRYGGSGTAEMALTAFYACSLLCMLRWEENRQWGDLILIALFSASMTWTKNEGLALAAINALLIAVPRKRGEAPLIMVLNTTGKPHLTATGKRGLSPFAAAGILALIIAAIYLPWIIFSWGLPRTDENYAGRLNIHGIISNIPRLPTIFAGFAVEMARCWDWGLFWLIALGLTITERSKFRHRAVALIGILLVLHLLAYIPPLMVTNWKLQELLDVSSDRLLMHATPAAAILIGLLWPEWAGGTPIRRDRDIGDQRPSAPASLV